MSFSVTACVTPQNSPIDDWMSFPVKRSSSRPGFSKNWTGTHDFLMDEFPSKTVCVTPHNSPIDDWMSFQVKRSSSRPGFSKNWIGTHDFWWMSFPVKRSQKFPSNLPIKVKVPCRAIKISDKDQNTRRDPNTILLGMGQKRLKRLCLMISLLKGYTRFGTECFCITQGHHQGHQRMADSDFCAFGTNP